MYRALAALKFLTFLNRLEIFQTKPRDVGQAAVYFPLVGIVLGVALSILNRFLEPYLESEVLSVALVATLALFTGASHLESLQNTFDEIPARTIVGDRRESGGRIFGLLAAVVILLFKTNALEAVGETRNLSLLLTPTVARWALIIFLYGGSSAAEEETAKIVAGQVRAWHLIVATVFVLAFTVFIAGRTGLWIALCVSLFALFGRSFVQHRPGGLRSDHFGALVEMAEAVSLVAFTIL